jgi:hypothetical protein
MLKPSERAKKTTFKITLNIYKWFIFNDKMDVIIGFKPLTTRIIKIL